MNATTTTAQEKIFAPYIGLQKITNVFCADGVQRNATIDYKRGDGTGNCENVGLWVKVRIGRKTVNGMIRDYGDGWMFHPNTNAILPKW